MEFAFKFEDLEDHYVDGEQAFPGISNLDNDVHPLFKMENFRLASAEDETNLLKDKDPTFDTSAGRMDKKIYERILPGLRLATLLLAHSGPFFSQVLHGDLEARQVKRIRTRDEVEDWTFQWVNVIEEVRFSQTLIATQRESFAQHVAENALFYFDSALEDHWGSTRVSYQERCRYTIAIGKKLIRLFCEGIWHQTPAQTRRYMNFQLATTIIHELAHVAWYSRWWNERLLDDTQYTEEAICSHDEEQVELGQSWENWFFKGSLCPINCFDVLKPPRWEGYTWAPFTKDYLNGESISYPDAAYGCTAVASWSINRFFQKERWEKHTDKSEPFTIELTPVNSLSCETWLQPTDEIYMKRLTLNHESLANPRRQFQEEF